MTAGRRIGVVVGFAGMLAGLALMIAAQEELWLALAVLGFVIVLVAVPSLRRERATTPQPGKREVEEEPAPEAELVAGRARTGNVTVLERDRVESPEERGAATETRGEPARPEPAREPEGAPEEPEVLDEPARSAAPLAASVPTALPRTASGPPAAEESGQRGDERPAEDGDERPAERGDERPAEDGDERPAEDGAAAERPVTAPTSQPADTPPRALPAAAAWSDPPAAPAGRSVLASLARRPRAKIALAGLLLLALLWLWRRAGR